MKQLKNKTKTMTPHMKTRIILLIGLFTILFENTSYAQLDTKHWIPPFYAKPGPNSGTSNLQKHFVSLSTPTTDTIPVVIEDGYGQLIDTVWIARSMPVEYTFGPTGNGTTDTYPLNVIPTDSLNLKIRSQGLYFSSYQPFFVNMRHKSQSQGTSLTSKGQVALGKRFYSGHIYTIYNNSDVWNNERRSHFISVMATEDNTVVTFDMIKDPIEFIGHPGADEVVVTLNAFESYTVGIDHSLYDNATINNANGTRITSNKNIVCNTGSWLAGNQQGQCIGSDQLVPSEVTGNEYILVRGLGDETTERPMVVATEDGTSVFLNGNPTPVAVLDEGEFHLISTSDFTAEENLYVLASEKVFMYQSLSGSATNIGQTVGLNFIPPLNCIGAKEVVLPFVNSLFNQNSPNSQAQINIITKAGTSIFVNESITPLTGSEIVTGNPDWVTYAFDAPTDNVIIESDSVMNVALLAQSGAVGSAGYFSGFTIEPVVGISAGISGSQPCIPGNAVLQVFGFDAYQWFFNGEELQGATGPTLFPEFSGDYLVEGIDIACGYRFPSNNFSIPFCPSTLGVAKNEESVVETAPGSNIFEVTYRMFITNLAGSPTQNVQVLESINAGLPLGATAELVEPPVLVLDNALTGGLNPDFDGDTDRRLLPGNGTLGGGASAAIQLKIRVDMNAAEYDGYRNQVTVTSKDGATNNGVDGPFNGQDFSNDGTNPDPNGNGEPNEDGENDPTLTCFYPNDISYESLAFCNTESEELVEIDGVTPGIFTVDIAGLEIDPTLGNIDPSQSIPGTYNVTFTIDSIRCPVTMTHAEVTIIALPIPGTPVANTEVCTTSDAINLDDYITGGDAGGSWTDGEGLANDGTFDPFAPGDYEFIYTVEAEPCTPQSVSVTINVIAEPVPGIAIDDASVCLSDGTTDLFDYITGEDTGGIWKDENDNEIASLVTLADFGDYNYTYHVSNDACGEREVALVLSVIEPSDSGISLGEETICAGEDIDLIDFLVEPDLGGVWTDVDGEEVDPTEPISETGSLVLTYTVQNEPCVSASTDITFNVVQGPSPGVPDNPILLCTEGEAVNMLVYMDGADAGGVWTNEDGETVPEYFNPEEPGVFVFTYTITSDDCGEIRADLILEVDEDNCEAGVVKVPQGFSPNGDGVADFWVVQGLLEGHPNHKVQIYNRWGNLVYSAGPYNNDWNGSSESGLNSGEPLPVGTYYYMIEFGDDTEDKKGYVYLNR